MEVKPGQIWQHNESGEIYFIFAYCDCGGGCNYLGVTNGAFVEDMPPSAIMNNCEYVGDL